ncbi:proline iminopeptidase-family hydrolase [Phenylobacterium sp.]|uniref:proline iminopeptidase-family hydrolase n=1 Tax=Phenylobacterium sp. TaxID=1871053 RepID=UPI0025E9F05D|nr:proline iminopeptidase-family hydrolase [Phenylobacterium sp.]
MDFTRRGAIGAAAAAGLAGCSKAVPAPSQGKAAVPGGDIWWKRVGTGGKTPILTLHGGPGAAHNYLHSLEALATDRQVIFYDQLGCGLADSPADEKIYTIQRAVDEVDAVRKALGLEKIILFGHSWGGMLAIEYLCQGRGKGVEKLILGGALASVPQAAAGQQRLIDQLPDGKGARLHALEAAHQEASPEYQAITELFYKLHVCRVPPDPEAQTSFDALGRSIAYRVMNGLNEFTITGVIKDWDRRADLGKIRLPTLITTGEFDEVTLDCHQTIRDAIQGSRLEVMADCSHMTMVEKPDAYAALLKGFV